MEAPTPPAPPDMTTLATVASLAQAEAMRMELELNNIPVEIQGLYTAGIVPIAGAAFGGIPIRVPATELQRAREVLSARMRSRDKGIYECPRCHSDHIHYQNNARRQMPLLLMGLLFPPILLFMLYIMMSERNREEYQCQKCGHHWAVTRQKNASRRFVRL